MADVGFRCCANPEVAVRRRLRYGRGRQGRQWFDGAGNFMGSTAVRRLAGDPPAPTLALLAGIALHEAAVPLVPDPRSLRLKWPNDLFYGYKLAGVLAGRHDMPWLSGVLRRQAAMAASLSQ